MDFLLLPLLLLQLPALEARKKENIRVLVVPHSHMDVGWIHTVQVGLGSVALLRPGGRGSSMWAWQLEASRVHYRHKQAGLPGPELPWASVSPSVQGSQAAETSGASKDTVLVWVAG